MQNSNSDLYPNPLTLSFQNAALEGEYLAEVAKRRWPVLLFIFCFDVVCYLFRITAKSIQLMVESGPLHILGRGWDLAREFGPQLANMAVLYLFLGLLNRRSRRLGDRAARQEEVLLSVCMAFAICNLLASLSPDNSQDYVYVAFFLICTSTFLKIRWWVGTLIQAVPTAMVQSLVLAGPNGANWLLNLLGHRAASATDSEPIEGGSGTCSAAAAAAISGIISGGHCGSTGGSLTSAGVARVTFPAMSFAVFLPPDAAVHVAVAWAVGGLMAYLADWYQRQMFAHSKLAAVAHSSELMEAQARIAAQRALAAAQAQAAQRALSVAREKAANEAKSEFMSLMCHEVRTPLNGCLASAEMLLETPLQAEQRELAATIRVSGSILLSTVSNFLDFFKLEAGKALDIVRASTDLRQLVADVHCIIEAMIGRGGEVLLLEPHMQGLTSYLVYCDADRVRGILLNLYTNAAKFTKQGHIQLRVREVPPGYAPEPMPGYSAIVVSPPCYTGNKAGGSGGGGRGTGGKCSSSKDRADQSESVTVPGDVSVPIASSSSSGGGCQAEGRVEMAGPPKAPGRADDREPCCSVACKDASSMSALQGERTSPDEGLRASSPSSGLKTAGRERHSCDAPSSVGCRSSGAAAANECTEQLRKPRSALELSSLLSSSIGGATAALAKAAGAAGSRAGGQPGAPCRQRSGLAAFGQAVTAALRSPVLRCPGAPEPLPHHGCHPAAAGHGGATPGLPSPRTRAFSGSFGLAEDAGEGPDEGPTECACEGEAARTAATHRHSSHPAVYGGPKGSQATAREPGGARGDCGGNGKGSSAGDGGAEGEPLCPRWLLFEVADTGTGITPEALRTLFREYVQGTEDEMRKPRSKGGTGLGLSICSKQVGLLGGRIGAYSCPGQGSIFWFTIPLIEVCGEREGKSASSGTGQAAASLLAQEGHGIRSPPTCSQVGSQSAKSAELRAGVTDCSVSTLEGSSSRSNSTPCGAAEASQSASGGEVKVHLGRASPDASAAAPQAAGAASSSTSNADLQEELAREGGPAPATASSAPAPCHRCSVTGAAEAAAMSGQLPQTTSRTCGNDTGAPLPCLQQKGTCEPVGRSAALSDSESVRGVCWGPGGIRRMSGVSACDVELYVSPADDRADRREQSGGTGGSQPNVRQDSAGSGLGLGQCEALAGPEQGDAGSVLAFVSHAPTFQQLDGGAAAQLTSVPPGYLRPDAQPESSGASDLPAAVGVIRGGVSAGGAMSIPSRNGSDRAPFIQVASHVGGFSPPLLPHRDSVGTADSADGPLGERPSGVGISQPSQYGALALPTAVPALSGFVCLTAPLPLSAATSGAVRPPCVTGVGGGASSSRVDHRSLAGRRVLLVEDNLINQTVARKMLTSLGLHCEVASNGLEALQRIERAMETSATVEPLDGVEAQSRTSGTGGGANGFPPKHQPTVSASGTAGNKEALPRDAGSAATTAPATPTSTSGPGPVPSPSSLSSLAYDVVLMDMAMPVMGGVDATRAIRRLGCQVPIVAMTANALERDREECRLAGMNGFLSKPVLKERLAESLVQVLEQEARVEGGEQGAEGAGSEDPGKPGHYASGQGACSRRGGTIRDDCCVATHQGMQQFRGPGGAGTLGPR